METRLVHYKYWCLCGLIECKNDMNINHWGIILRQKTRKFWQKDFPIYIFNILSISFNCCLRMFSCILKNYVFSTISIHYLWSDLHMLITPFDVNKKIITSLLKNDDMMTLTKLRHLRFPYKILYFLESIFNMVIIINSYIIANVIYCINISLDKTI